MRYEVKGKRSNKKKKRIKVFCRSTKGLFIKYDTQPPTPFLGKIKRKRLVEKKLGKG